MDVIYGQFFILTVSTHPGSRCDAMRSDILEYMSLAGMEFDE